MQRSAKSINTKTNIVAASPTDITTAAHAANDVVSKFTVNAVVPRPGGTGVLDGIIVNDGSNQKAQLDFYFFDSAPTSQTSNQPINVALSDSSKFVCKATVASYDEIASGVYAVADKNDIGAYFKCAKNSRNLHCLVATRGTPTYSSTTVLSFKFKVLLD